MKFNEAVEDKLRQCLGLAEAVRFSLISIKMLVFLSPANELDIVNPVPTSQQEHCSWNLGVKVRTWCVGKLRWLGCKVVCCTHAAVYCWPQLVSAIIDDLRWRHKRHPRCRHVPRIVYYHPIKTAVRTESPCFISNVKLWDFLLTFHGLFPLIHAPRRVE